MSKVLIVEDELSIAELEKDYLELSSFEVEIETENKNIMDDFYSFVEKWEVKNEEA